MAKPSRTPPEASKPPKIAGEGRHAAHPESPEHLSRVYRALEGIPGVCEKTAWGSPTFRTGPEKSDRMFASLHVDHHGDGRVAIWCAAPPGTQQLLAETAPERTFVPPYVGVNGWIGVLLDRTDDFQLSCHLREAWRAVAPKKRLAGKEIEKKRV